MPAVITHHIFGEDAAALLPAGILEGQEDLLAFLLGNQGTDPFWARTLATPRNARSCHQFATMLHSKHMTKVFSALHKTVSHLREQDMSVGRAFALGMGAHYVLDSIAHPLIYAQQEGIIAADPSLEPARGEIHAIIESDIDSWLLWEKRGKTVLDVPCSHVLASTDHINRVAGSMLSQVAWEVFDLNVGAAEYGLAIRDYRMLYRLIDPPVNRLQCLLPKIERMSRTHSRLQALSHRVLTSDDCPLANLEHHLWRNPDSNEASRASFADLFHDALLAWPEFSLRIAQGDPRRLGAMIADVDYNGRIQ